MRTAIACAATLFLTGCWFVYLPGSAVSSLSDTITGSFGNSCIGESVKVGDKVRGNEGRPATVTRISGASSRCQDQTPIRAEITYD